MSINIWLYSKLVNQVPEIRRKYKAFRYGKGLNRRPLCWLYLIGMNIRNLFIPYRILPNQFRRDKILIPHDKSESTLSLMVSPQDFIKSIDDANIISFDVFDTLVLRRFCSPTDVFYLVGEKLNYPNFHGLRIKAENLARRNKIEKENTPEVSLNEIWHVMERISGISSFEGIMAEIETEMESCIANPYFVNLVPALKKLNKKIIVCSDMYLSTDSIKKILNRCGYPEFDGYYVSNSLRVTKSDGSMFSKLKEIYGENQTIIHIGDNPVSDYEYAKRNGIKSILYHNVNILGEKYRPREMSVLVGSIYKAIINNELHNGLYGYSMMYELGFVYGGLFVVGYCKFIHSYVEKNKIDKILFLSRDGEILYKAYKALYPSDVDQCNYVYWSRSTAIRLTAHRFRYQYIQRMIIHKNNQNYSLHDIFASMGICDMLHGFLSQTHSRYTRNSKLDSSVSDELENYLYDNWQLVISHYTEEERIAKEYYQNVIGSSKSVAVVDVGWVGSGPLSLRYLIEERWRLNCSVYGLLAGTCSANDMEYDYSESELTTGILTSYLFSESKNRDIWEVHDASKGHNLLVEILLSSNTFSFKSFMPSPNNDFTFCESKESIDSDSIQAGILNFVDKFMTHPFKDVYIDGRDAIAPILTLYQEKNYISKLIAMSGIHANVE